MYKETPWTTEEKTTKKSRVRKSSYIKERQADLAVSTARVLKLFEVHKEKAFNTAQVAEALEQRLIQMKSEEIAPDVLTFAGNGEPTVHPEFASIINDTLLLRDRHFPKAKVSVLTNATRIIIPEIHEALMKVDNNIIKLDTVNTDYIN